MDAWPVIEMRARLTFPVPPVQGRHGSRVRPRGLYERNPDHYVTARAVESAAAISGAPWDYPEFPRRVQAAAIGRKYYFSRGPQLVNRVVDISGYIDQKVM